MPGGADHTKLLKQVEIAAEIEAWRLASHEVTGTSTTRPELSSLAMKYDAFPAALHNRRAFFLCEWRGGASMTLRSACDDGSGNDRSLKLFNF
jgi:hypothetical protein